MISHERETTLISIHGPSGKRWSSDTEAVCWPELIEEFIYGLRGMGFFISVEHQDKILEACESEFSKEVRMKMGKDYE